MASANQRLHGAARALAISTWPETATDRIHVTMLRGDGRAVWNLHVGGKAARRSVRSVLLLALDGAAIALAYRLPAEVAGARLTVAANPRSGRSSWLDRYELPLVPPPPPAAA